MAGDISGRDKYVIGELHLHPPERTPSTAPPAIYLPPKPANFVGRQEHLEALRAALLAEPAMFLVSGDPGNGKSTLAQMFAWQVQKQFEAVVYQICGRRNVDIIVAELAETLKEQIGEHITQRPVEEKLRLVKSWLGQRRALLVLDDIWLNDSATPVTTAGLKMQDLLPGPSVTVLFTSRRPALPWTDAQHRLHLDAFTPAEVEETFRLYLGTPSVERYKQELLEFAERVERLPIAVAVGAQLLQSEFGPLDEAARAIRLGQLRNDILDVPGLLRHAVESQGESERRLLMAAAVCTEEGFWMAFAVDVAGVSREEGKTARNNLVNAALLRVVDQDRQQFQLHGLLREQLQAMAASSLMELQQAHAQVLERLFEEWESRWKECRECLGEVLSAMQFLRRQNEATRAAELAYRGFSTAYRIGELDTALRIQQQNERFYQDCNHKDGLRVSYGSQALILKAWGRLDEAMTLHKKEEAICEEFGNKDSLQRSYGNQAGILYAWGRLAEALVLYNKQEAICEELGNKDGLQLSYSGQALILKDWGRLEDALNLMKKEEEICLELSNMDSLQRSYGNQAGIQRFWGRSEEALGLYKKQEVICAQLGNRDGLQRSYSGQGLILMDWGQLEDALALMKKEEEICMELGNKDSLQRSYGNQALILQDWGQLEAALVLYKKKEAICMELGNKASLGHCYWYWGLLARKLNDQATENQKLEAALTLFTGLKMVRERDAVQAELDGGAAKEAAGE